MSEEPRQISGEFSAGSVVGGYRLEQRIGQGGMAVVFRAYDARLDRRVALKILAPALARDDAFRQRFIGEWRAAAALDDRHIIPVFDAGEAGGVLFIAMRYVQGGDVRSLLNREGPLPPARAIEIISQAASALDSTHARGLVHRDVKPANMLLEESTHSDQPDHVYLSDFGLTKAMSAAIGLTGSGQLIGTVDYLAPEQIEGGPIDGRTDLYALACTAFELLTGVPPFHRHERVAVMYAQVTEPPPPLSSQRPGLPAAADTVMARALAKSPADRYQTCREFATALRRAFGAAASGSPAAMPEGLRTPPAEPLPRMTGHRAESPAPRPAAGGQPTEAAGYPAASARPQSSSAEPPTETADIPATPARARAAIPPGQAGTRGGAAPRGVRPGDQESGAARRGRRPWWRSPLPVGVICAIAVAAGVGSYFLFGRGGGSADSGSTALTVPGCTTSQPGLAKSREVPGRKYRIDGTPFAVLESKDRQYTFVTVGNGLAVLRNGSGTALEPLHPISVSGVNKGMVMSPTGNYIIAADNSGAVVISTVDAENDPGAPTLVKGKLTSQYGGAVGIQISRHSHYLFVSLQDSSRMLVFNYHHALSQNSFGPGDIVKSVRVEGQPVGVAESTDGKWLYVTSYRASTREPRDGTLSAISVTESHNSLTMTVKATVNAGCTPAGVVADGTTIWVTAHDSNTVMGFSASALQHGGKNARIADVRVGPAPIGLIPLPGGQRLAVADSNSTSKPSRAGNLAVVSTANALAHKPALLCTIPLAAQPREMALAQGGTVLLIAEQAPSQLQAIEVSDLRC